MNDVIEERLQSGENEASSSSVRHAAFAPYSQDVFYEEPQRTQRFSILLNLAPYSDLLVVSGLSGSGKTTLLQRFQQNMQDKARICCVTATAEVTLAQLMAALCDSFSSAQALSSEMDDQLQQVREQAYIFRRSIQVPMLIIDDAHLLADEVLLGLKALFDSEDPDEHVNVVLFCEPSLTDRLQQDVKLKSLQEQVAHTFDLLPLSLEETGRYIAYHLECAGDERANPFTSSVLKVVHQNAEGLPGRINEIAREILLSSSGDAGILSGIGRAQHLGRYLLVGLGVVFLGFVLINQDVINGWVSGQSDGSSNVPLDLGVEDKAAIVLPVETEEALPELALSAAPTLETISIGEVSKPAKTAVAPKLERALGVVIDKKPSAAKNVDKNQWVNENSVKPKPAPAKPNPVVQKPKPITAKPKTSPKVVVKAPIAIDPEEFNVSSDGEETWPEVRTPKRVKPVVVKKRSGFLRESWILSQPKSGYILQLMAMADEKSVSQYIKRRGLMKKAGYFRRSKRGSVMYVVVYGQYSSREAAAKASKTLPASLKGTKAWVRAVKDVQAEITASR